MVCVCVYISLDWTPNQLIYNLVRGLGWWWALSPPSRLQISITSPPLCHEPSPWEKDLQAALVAPLVLHLPINTLSLNSASLSHTLKCLSMEPSLPSLQLIFMPVSRNPTSFLSFSLFFSFFFFLLALLLSLFFSFGRIIARLVFHGALSPDSPSFSAHSSLSLRRGLHCKALPAFLQYMNHSFW